MNPVDEGILGTRIAKIRHSAERLKSLVNGPRDEFIQDESRIVQAERYLQIAAQAMLDIGAYLLAKKSQAKPEEYRGIFADMGRIGILPKEFAKKIEGLAGMRNIIVHEYMEVDPGLLYDNIKEGLSDFEQFCLYTIQFTQTLR